MAASMLIVPLHDLLPLGCMDLKVSNTELVDTEARVVPFSLEKHLWEDVTEEERSSELEILWHFIAFWEVRKLVWV